MESESVDPTASGREVSEAAPGPQLVADPEPAKKPTEAQLNARPWCHNCKADPVMPLAQTFNMGPFTVLLVYCSACRVLLPACLLAAELPDPSRIAVPSRGRIHL